jgi:hypothetical protein
VLPTLSLYVPIEHVMHVSVLLLAPNAVANVPMAQAVHALAKNCVV